MSSAVQQARQGLILTTSTVLALILLFVVIATVHSAQQRLLCADQQSRIHRHATQPHP